MNFQTDHYTPQLNMNRVHCEILTLTLLVDTTNTLAEENHSTTGATKRLVSGGHNNISILKW